MLNPEYMRTWKLYIKHIWKTIISCFLLKIDVWMCYDNFTSDHMEWSTRMKENISFSVPGSMAIHELQVGVTLARFLEFDLEYFGKQCVESFEKSQKTGDTTLDKTLAVKEYLRNCHPYCAATLKTDFDLVALDCIIDHICQTEDAGLEELWVRYLAAEKPFEKAIFERITDYKSGYAINQWTNLVRMRTYAASKASVIYGDGETDVAIHRARALYYDMMFRVAASKLGFESGELPQIRYYSLPLMPEAMSLLRNAVNTLEDAMKPLLASLDKKEPIKGRECVRDQMAGMAVSAIRGVKRPDDFELRQFIQMYRSLPDNVFEPSGLKAIIDLEFDQLLEKGFYLKPQENSYIREKYAVRRGAGADPAAPLPVLKTIETVPQPVQKAPAPPETKLPETKLPETKPPEAAEPKPSVMPPVKAPPLAPIPLKVPPLPPVPFSVKQTSAPAPASQRKPADGERRPRGRPKGTTKTRVVLDVKASQEQIKPAVTPLPVPFADQRVLPDTVKPKPPQTAAALTQRNIPEEPFDDEIPEDDAFDGEGKVETIIRLAEDTSRKRSRDRSLQEINNRCNLIWTSMNVRLGWTISAEEASLWSKYLSRLRVGVATGTVEPAALDRFLDATLEIFKILPVNA